MSGLERSDVVLDHSAQTDNFNRMRADGILFMVSVGDVEKGPGHEDNYEDAGGSAGEELEMEVALAEEPCACAPKKAWPNAGD
jgi:hypothetical protein